MFSGGKWLSLSRAHQNNRKEAFHKPLAMSGVFGTMVFLTVSCGPAIQPGQHPQVRLAAPQGPKDVGMLVKGVPEDSLLTYVEKHPHARLRVLSRQRNASLSEVFGIERADLLTAFPKARIEPNQFFRPMHHARPIAPLNSDEMMRMAGQKCLKSSTKGGPVPTIRWDAASGPAAGSTSELVELAPSGLHKAVSEASEEDEDSAAGPETRILLMPLKRSLHLFAETDFPVPPAARPTGSAPRYIWMIVPPEDSLESTRLHFGQELYYSPDNMGVHGIRLLVSDNNEGCGIAQMLIVVSADPVYRKMPPSDDVFGLLPPLGFFSHLRQLGFSSGQREKAGAGMTVAVIDTGVNYLHPAMNPNIALNQREIPNNGIDDDENGFVDDVYGYDFVYQDAHPYDDVGHGSHVAGLAAAQHFGLANAAQILPIKAISPFGGDVGTILAAINYAVERKAQVINMSFGTQGTNELLDEALREAQDAGALLVAAAGNGDPDTGLGIDNDKIPHFPANASGEAIISVAAINAKGELSRFSNFGTKSVDVAAPGGDSPKGDGIQQDVIQSTYYENARGELFKGMSGTSMAAPLVAGLAAEIWSAAPYLRAHEVREAILRTARPTQPLQYAVASGGAIDPVAARAYVLSVASAF